MDNAEQTHK